MPSTRRRGRNLLLIRWPSTRKIPSDGRTKCPGSQLSAFDPDTLDCTSIHAVQPPCAIDRMDDIYSYRKATTLIVISTPPDMSYPGSSRFPASMPDTPTALTSAPHTC